MTLSTIWKFLNKAALILFLLVFRRAVLDNDMPMQVFIASLILGNAYFHWRNP